jgi:hypothetical protein
MYFDATPGNVTALLVVSLALVTIIFLMQKRYDSNLPLLFYFISLSFQNMADRQLNPYLMYSGLLLALTLRFEFMGQSFTKFIAFCTTMALLAIVWIMLADIFFPSY